MTNLNEDPQLSGKLHYSLATLFDTPVTIGRAGSSPAPTVVLRGAGIMDHHCTFELDDHGLINLKIAGDDCYENTLVNGKKLGKAAASKSNFTSAQNMDQKVEYSVRL